MIRIPLRSIGTVVALGAAICAIAGTTMAQQETGYGPDSGETAFATQSESYFSKLQEKAVEEGKTRCADDATAQSPLNLVTSAVTADSNLAPVVINYVKYATGDELIPTVRDSSGRITRSWVAALHLDMVNTGHTVQIVTDPEKYKGRPAYSKPDHMLSLPTKQQIVVDGRTFTLKQFHFHRPSEHLIDNKRYALEMHLVHEADTKVADGLNEAVVAVLMDIGETDNSAMREIFWRFRNVGLGRDPKWQIERYMVDYDTILPTNRGHIRYDGSLTTPSCTSDVAWHVFTTPIMVSAQQVADFRGAVPFNARATQNAHNTNPRRSPGKKQ